MDCNKDVYNNGTSVFLTHTLSAKDTETWVKEIAKLSGQKVDWHYIAGRANILALGDLTKVRDAIKSLRHMHDHFFFKKAVDSVYFDPEDELRIVKGIWNYNGF